MKRLICLLLVVVSAWSQTASIGDTLEEQKQVTIPQRVVRPSFRWVSPAASVGDSIIITIKCNKTIAKVYKYTLTQAALDTSNVTKAIITGWIDDVSK